MREVGQGARQRLRIARGRLRRVRGVEADPGTETTDPQLYPGEALQGLLGTGPRTPSRRHRSVGLANQRGHQRALIAHRLEVDDFEASLASVVGQHGQHTRLPDPTRAGQQQVLSDRPAATADLVKPQYPVPYQAIAPNQ